MKEITVVAKNEIEALATITESLGNTGINIEAVSAYERNNNAVIRLVTNDATSAMKALSKIPNIQAKESDIIVLRLPNKPGELGKITRKLALKKINVESVYIISKAHEYTEVAIKPSQDDFAKTELLFGIRVH
ncbi:MAG: hypothetical protein AABX38_05485 [Candidatus Micrarchaeota archaeon]